uniref:Uncharacterized protein n=1 Tax=Onchocerca volvulus TaxID=6282 RepID=A0A8R1TQN9_ONCVO
MVDVKKLYNFHDASEKMSAIAPRNLKLIIALIFILQIGIYEQVKLIKQTKLYEDEYKVSASYNSQCSYNPFSRNNDFSAHKPIVSIKNIYDSLRSNIHKRIDQIIKWLYISIKHNTDTILCILQMDLRAMLKKIKGNAVLFDSRLIHHSLIGVNATTQTNPTLRLFRKRELNEKTITRQTDV